MGRIRSQCAFLLTTHRLMPVGLLCITSSSILQRLQTKPLKDCYIIAHYVRRSPSGLKYFLIMCNHVHSPRLMVYHQQTSLPLLHVHPEQSISL